MNIYKCPTNIRRNIFLKMGNTEIVRMRQTCSAMNSFVEENKEKLSSRTEIGLDLAIEIDRKQPDKIVVSHGKTVLDYGNDLNAMLSAVTIKSLRLHIKISPTTFEEVFQIDDDFTQELSMKLFEFIKTVKISCDRLQLSTISARVALQMTDYVSPRETTFFYYKGLQEADYLDVISKDKNCSSFNMSIRALGAYPGVFEKAKHINSIYTRHFYYLAFRAFIWEICCSPDHGNFTSLYAGLEPALEIHNVFEDPQHPMPAFRTIWDKSTVSQELCNGQDIPSKIRIFNQAGTVIFYQELRFDGNDRVFVNIARNDEEILFRLTEQFYNLKIVLPENFMMSTEEEQVILFKNAVMAEISSAAN